ncbi:hypothetical protein [Nocardia mexicana]|uniref:Uncharacterized protein n=1 Tax=Nocardia mexicana TaxID=279262 RepID=A0A370GIM5_9NOCA|nr:hypothetical protein [Nocardia mexicana]RDI41783.1 hypothetical protein DFR68_13032 [Nocardia mexicana]
MRSTTRTMMVAAAVMLAATGCGTRHPPVMSPTQGPSHPPAVPVSDYTFPVQWAGDYTFRWSAADGIALTDSVAAVVRGFAESKRLSMSVGARLAYPGYADTITTVSWLQYPDGGFYPVGAEEGNWSQRWQGTFHARILDIQPTADGYLAAYCLDTTDVTQSDDSGATFYWLRPTTGFSTNATTWLTIQADPIHGQHNSEPAAGQSGQPPRRAPNYDVFAGWIISDAWGPSPRKPDQAPQADACNSWIQATPHTAPLDANSAARTLFATPPTPGAPYPGWPAHRA